VFFADASAESTKPESPTPACPPYRSKLMS